MRPPDVGAPDEAVAAAAGREDGTGDAEIVAAERQRVAAHDQAIANLRARAATKRITLHVLDAGDGLELLFVWCGLSKCHHSIDAAAIWLDHIGASR